MGWLVSRGAVGSGGAGPRLGRVRSSCLGVRDRADFVFSSAISNRPFFLAACIPRGLQRFTTTALSDQWIRKPLTTRWRSTTDAPASQTVPRERPSRRTSRSGSEVWRLAIRRSRFRLSVSQRGDWVRPLCFPQLSTDTFGLQTTSSTRSPVTSSTLAPPSRG